MKKNLSSIKRIIKNILYILSPEQKRESVIVFLSMLLSSFLEVVGVSVIYPFLMLIGDEESMRQKFYLAWIYQLDPSISAIKVTIFLGVTVAVIYVIKNLVSVLCTYCQVSYSAKINKELSVRMLNSYMKRPYEFFVNTRTPVVLRGLNGDVNAVYSIILYGFQTIAELLTILLIFLYLVKLDPFVAVTSLALGGVSFLAITAGFKGVMKRLGKDSREQEATRSGTALQIITGIKEIMVLDRQSPFVRKYDSVLKKNATITKKMGVVNAIPDRCLEVTCVVALMLVLCMRVAQGVDPRTFLPTLGAFAMGIFRIMPSMAKLSGRINNIVYFVPGLDNAYDLIKETEEIERQYDAEEKELKEQIIRYKYDKLSFHNEIKIDKVHWKYKNSNGEVLRGLSLSVRCGESVGIIGASGGGKSTLVDVLMTLFRPQSGSITMDGVDIFLMKHRWRNMIGYVPQAVFLTDDTVRKNVAFGLSEDEISDDHVWRALEQAQLKEFVQSLPNQLNTIVGEFGVRFSGGQRQRIAIARALYDEPEILIFDEATSALDNETEKEFMAAIDFLQGKKTIILVAHRLTTVKNCDRIYEIKDGLAFERDVQDVIAEI